MYEFTRFIAKKLKRLFFGVGQYPHQSHDHGHVSDHSAGGAHRENPGSKSNPDGS